MTCPRCGHDAEEGARFCVHCGMRIPDTTAQEAVSPENVGTTEPGVTVSEERRASACASPAAEVAPTGGAEGSGQELTALQEKPVSANTLSAEEVAPEGGAEFSGSEPAALQEKPASVNASGMESSAGKNASHDSASSNAGRGRQLRRCPHCGYTLQPNDVFCNRCGKPVSGADPNNTWPPYESEHTLTEKTPRDDADDQIDTPKRKMSTGARVGIIAGVVAAGIAVWLLVPWGRLASYTAAVATATPAATTSELPAAEPSPGSAAPSPTPAPPASPTASAKSDLMALYEADDGTHGPRVFPFVEGTYVGWQGNTIRIVLGETGTEKNVPYIVLPDSSRVRINQAGSDSWIFTTSDTDRDVYVTGSRADDGVDTGIVTLYCAEDGALSGDYANTSMQPLPTKTTASTRAPVPTQGPVSTKAPVASYTLEELVLQGDQRYYTDAELSTKTPYELSILRNGLFALSGKQFQYNQDVIDFFGNCTWYAPDTTSDEVVKGRFNKYQVANLAAIQSYEKQG